MAVEPGLAGTFLKIRPISPSLRGEEIWNDIPGKIGRAMGGQAFFFESEATSIHRIGIGLGLGWRLPRYVQRKDRINHLQVRINSRGLLNFYFLNSGENPADGADLIHAVRNLQYADLKPTYERVMHDSL